MAAFDPDEFIKPTAPTPPVAGGFDPDAFLQQPTSTPPPGAFDPDTFTQPASTATPAAEGSLGTQIARGAVLGAKKALNPWGVTKEEFKRKQGWAEMISDALTNMFAGVGAAGATGALAAAVTGGEVGAAAGPVGILAGAGIGALAYGLYAGLGNEVMRSRAEDQEFNPLRAMANVALEVNPLVKTTGKFLSPKVLARVAGQATGQAGLEYSYTKDPVAAAFAGGLGMVMAYPMYRGMRVAEDIPTTNAAKAAMSMLKDPGPDGLTVATARRLAKDPEMVFDRTKLDDEGFRRWFVSAPAGAEASTVASDFVTRAKKVSEEHLSDAWRSYRAHTVLVDEASKQASRNLRELGEQAVQEPTSTFGQWTKDGRFVADDVDHKTGLNTVGSLDLFSRSKDKHDLLAGGFTKQAVRTKRAGDKLGLAGEDIGRALAGRAAELSPQARKILATDEGRKVLGAWRQHFDDVRVEIRNAGYDVGYLIDFVPMHSLHGADLAMALQDRLAQLQKRAAAKGVRSVLSLGDDPLLKEVLKVAEFAGHKVGSDTDLFQLPKAAMRADVKQNLGFELSAMFQRRGEMPGFIRDWDVGRLFGNYVNTNLKAVNLDPAFRNMRANVDALNALGLPKAAQYFDRYMQHMSGIPGSGVAVQRQWGEELRLVGKKMSKEGNPLGGLVAGLPDFGAWATTLVYPAYLGANVRATLRNLTQTYATTAPEIGGKYGYSLVSRAAMRSAKDAMTPGAEGFQEFLKRKGQLGGMTRTDVLDDAGGLPGRAKEAADWANEKLMSLYTGTDVVNRYITMRVGREWAEDLIKGRGDAVAALRHLQAGKKQELLAANVGQLIKAGKVDELADSLGDYLVGKTQFRYGKEQLNQLGREFGPLVSMFTKWPVMVTSDIVNMYKQKGFKEATARTVGKYIGPYAALIAAGAALDRASQITKTTGYHYLVGDSGALSPMEAVWGLDFVGGPILRAGPEILKAGKNVATGASPIAEAAIGATRGILKHSPGVGPLMNELDRWYKAKGKAPYSTQVLESAALGRTPPAPNLKP
jgi:hypothetical protein